MNTQLITINSDPAHTLADLSQIAQQINLAVTAAETHAQQAVRSALRAGELLSQAKEQVPTGEWESWVANNCTVALRTAQAYMRLHKKLGVLPPDETQRVALLPLRQAMAAIATPPKPEARYRPAQHCESARAHKAIADASLSLKSLRSLVLRNRPVTKQRLRSAREKMQQAINELDQMLEAAL